METILLRIMQGSMCILVIGFLIVFIRAIKGPRFTDRIVAINMIGTMTTAMICILAVYLNQFSLIDIALVYTLLSFLTVVIICRVVTMHHKGRENFLKRQNKEEAEGH